MKVYRTLQSVKTQNYTVKPKIAIAVRVRNEILAIEDFWNSIKNQTIFDFLEILFIDCNSTDGTLEFLKNLNCNLYTIDPSEFSFGESCNLAMQLTESDLVCFFSGHVKLESENAIQQVYDFATLKGNISGYFRQIPNPSLGYSIYDEIFLKYRYPNFKVTPPLLVEKDKHSFSNAASLINRQHWEQTKFEDVIASEDYFWANAVIENHHSIYYFHKQSILHSHNESYNDIYKRVRINALARYPQGISNLKISFIFLKVFSALLYNSFKLKPSFKFAQTHAAAYKNLDRDING